MKKTLQFVAFLFLVIASKVMALPASNSNLHPPEIKSKSYLLYDYYSKQTLLEQNAHESLAPASLTKIMTMYVIESEIKQGKLNLTDLIHVSQLAWQATGSRMFLNVSSQVTVEDLRKGIIVQSGNDACIALAEHIAGSEQEFANLMNQYAVSFGLTNTNFVNATGLPNPNHYSSAHDLAIIADHLIRDFPESYPLYSLKEFTFNNITQPNRNRLLSIKPSVDGIKTGHTEDAGYCLISSAVENGTRLIAVNLNAASEKLRNQDALTLLNWGFRTFVTEKVYLQNTPITSQKIWYGDKKQLSLGCREDIFITVPRHQQKQLNATLKLHNKVLLAPLAAGSAIGSYLINIGDKEVLSVPVVALDNVEEGNFWSKSKDYFAILIESLADKLQLV